MTRESALRNYIQLLDFAYRGQAIPQETFILPRDHSCTIFFLYERIGSRFDSCAGPQSGVNTVKALIGSVRVGSVHTELRPDPNST